MNDLFSPTSKAQADLNRPLITDVESGPSANLEAFFTKVESINGDISDIERLRRHLQHSNEEVKTTHSSRAVKAARARMDRDVEQVLRKARHVKGKIEALDRFDGGGPELRGSTEVRTRIAVVTGLGKKLKDVMDEFQSLRDRINSDYKEILQRRYYTVTGEHADEETIQRLSLSDDCESFFEKVIEEQGKGHIMDTISEIQERHDAVEELGKNLKDLHQLFFDMSVLVQAQGEQLEDIESQVALASSFVHVAVEEIAAADQTRRSSRKWKFLAILLVIVIIIAILVTLLVIFIPKNQK